MASTIHLGRRDITQGTAPYIIAEIGVNHGGSLDQAKRLIDLAKEGGADAAKFQSYKAGSLASKLSPSYWDTTLEPTKSQYDLFKKYDNFGAQEYEQLAEHCRRVDIDFLSTPFDDEAIAFLDPLVPFFKIASADLTNTPFLRKVAEKKKPIVLSTGASNLCEIDTAINTLSEAGCVELALLHCILNYPTENRNAHLLMIKGLARAFPNYVIGYSDHTLPDKAMTPLLTAYLLGALILEKHFTHDKSLSGNDHYHSMDVADLARFVEISKCAHQLMGDSDHKSPIPTEELSRKNARRSIVVKRPIPENHQIQASDLTYKRPGSGISPQFWDDVIGRTTKRELGVDHILQWSDLLNESR